MQAAYELSYFRPSETVDYIDSNGNPVTTTWGFNWRLGWAKDSQGCAVRTDYTAAGEAHQLQMLLEAELLVAEYMNDPSSHTQTELTNMKNDVERVNKLGEPTKGTDCQGVERLCKPAQAPPPPSPPSPADRSPSVKGKGGRRLRAL